MNAVTQLDDSRLESVLTHYDIGNLLGYWPAANGIENSNFFVHTQHDDRQREFVLTIMEQPPYAGEGYIPLMHALAQQGLPVAPPLAAADGYFIQELAGKPAMLQTRLPGRHVYNPTRKQICSLARFMARMHSAIQAPSIKLPPYPRGVDWLREQVSKTQGMLPFADAALLTSTLHKVESLLARHDVQGLPQGMIHGDLFRDNVLFNSYGLSGVLDFHHAASGFWIYDLAVMANDWCTDAGGQLDPERTADMLRAYHQIRPLREVELWFFSSFALYAALAFWLSRLSAALAATRISAGRFKNPDEFKRIVEHHNRHSFYLDPRHLSM